MILEIVLVLVGFALLLWAAEILIRGATALARGFGISTLIIGLTVVAFGTSAPELFVSISASMKGTGDVAIGNVLGSNLFNILMIIGISALIKPVKSSRDIKKREMPIMLLALGLFWLFAAQFGDSEFTRLEGGILFGGILSYLGLSYYIVRSTRKGSTLVEELDEVHSDEEKSPLKNFLFIVIGLVGLIGGAELIVSNATVIAKAFGVSDFVIGVSLVAIGTSLPELATTIVSAAKGEQDLAVGNAVGSNIFNVFAVIGITGLLQPIGVTESALSFDFPFMFLACFAVWPLMFIRKELGRPEGALLVLAYAVYIYYVAVGGAPA